MAAVKSAKRAAVRKTGSPPWTVWHFGKSISLINNLIIVRNNGRRAHSEATLLFIMGSCSSDPNIQHQNLNMLTFRNHRHDREHQMKLARERITEPFDWRVKSGRRARTTDSPMTFNFFKVHSGNSSRSAAILAAILAAVKTKPKPQSWCSLKTFWFWCTSSSCSVPRPPRRPSADHLRPYTDQPPPSVR